MLNNTVFLHRVIQASPEKVYRVFSDPDALVNWLPPYGFICTVQHMEFKIGGKFQMTFINFSTGNSHSFGGEYINIESGKSIQYKEMFDDPNLLGEMTTTVSLQEVSCGTELHIEQKGIPEIIPLEMCYLGWQESLDKMKRLVEPEIPDA